MTATIIQQNNPIYVNVRSYGAQGNGISDDTTPISNAIAAVNAAGGGTIYFPPGTYLTGAQTIYSQCHYRGAGIGATTIKLKNNANADLFSSGVGNINISASFGAGSTGGVYSWSFSEMTLDGNKTNQTGTSYCIRVYGYGYILHNLVVRYAYTDGILTDWNGGSNSPGNDSMEAYYSNIKIHECGSVGLRFSGPHDSCWVNVISYKNTLHGFHVCPNAGVILATNCHSWGPALGNTSVAWLIEGEVQCINCSAEGSDTTQVALYASQCSWSGGYIFSNDTTSTGLMLGCNSSTPLIPGMVQQSGGVPQTVYAGGNLISSMFSQIPGANGSVYFANDGGNNIVTAVSYQTGASAKLFGGSPSLTNSQYMMSVNGLTTDGTPSTIGWHYTGTAWFQLGGPFQLSDQGSVTSVSSSGTINVTGYSMVRVSASSAATGVILQAGTRMGQTVTLINEGSNSITFAASATSHVAAGTSAVLAATSGKLVLTWDTNKSLWY